VLAPDMELPPIEWQTPEGVAAPVDGAPADPGTCRSTWVGAFRGWVADQSGRPVPEAKAQACIIVEPGGMLLCLRPADADETGVYTINVPENGACMSSVAMRVLKPGTGLATIYCVEDPAARVGGDQIIRTADPYVVYPTDAAAVPAGADLNAPSTITYQDGLEVEVVPGRVFTTSATIQAARARAIDPTDRGLCFLQGQPTPDRLYAFWPEAAIDGPGAPFKVPNDGGLAAGAQVDLFVLGGLECALEDGTHIPEGEWYNFGTGTVSADGAYIVNDAGSELPCFSWFGLKAR
ncbi:MAG: hypothetical protein KC613_05930, partial [Myxococcales bacterium]|nr:hypothetical protein [Myxococcales bacterium]